MSPPDYGDNISASKKKTILSPATSLLIATRALAG